MWLELPYLWIGLLNAIGIPTAHLGISWVFTKMALAKFDPDRFPFQRLSGESRVAYDLLFRVRSWKHLLPDAGPWFGGFAKKSLHSSDNDSLKRFRAETCRSEAAHWAQVLTIAAFTIWTPWPWALVIIAYAFASNLPCIILQRQNRLRLTAVIHHHEAST
jgi:glycosyl-4,4'-diaponeurosporenoate acyltransferase